MLKAFKNLFSCLKIDEANPEDHQDEKELCGGSSNDLEGSESPIGESQIVEIGLDKFGRPNGHVSTYTLPIFPHDADLRSENVHGPLQREDRDVMGGVRATPQKPHPQNLLRGRLLAGARG